MHFKRLKYIAIMFVLLTPLIATAELLSPNQIRILLANKTAVWKQTGGVQYQYFDQRGVTIFQDNKGQHEKGVWTVTDNGMFCSNWEVQGWICYRLSMRNGNQLMWQGPINSIHLPNVTDQFSSELFAGNKTTYKMGQLRYRPKIFAGPAKVITGEYVMGAEPQPENDPNLKYKGAP